MHRNSTMIVWDNKINYLFKFQEISNWSLHWRENCMCMQNSKKKKNYHRNLWIFKCTGSNSTMKERKKVCLIVLFLYTPIICIEAVLIVVKIY